MMTQTFSNGNFKEFKAAIEKKKSTLILAKTEKTQFGWYF